MCMLMRVKIDAKPTLVSVKTPPCAVLAMEFPKVSTPFYRRCRCLFITARAEHPASHELPCGLAGVLAVLVWARWRNLSRIRRCCSRCSLACAATSSLSRCIAWVWA